MLTRRGYLTAEEAEKTLRIPCIEILKGWSQVSFPNRNKGRPSIIAYISPVTTASQLRQGIYVSGHQWETCVVPILKDPTWIEQTRGLTAPLCDSDDLILYLGSVIRESFKQKGY
jgi:hypothetical protein